MQQQSPCLIRAILACAATVSTACRAAALGRLSLGLLFGAPTDYFYVMQREHIIVYLAIPQYNEAC